MREETGRFMAAVYRLVRRIPRGCVLTYGEIAVQLGRPHAARAVGHAMRVCPPGIPWHRVVNARGGISARAPMSGMLTQRIRLEQEGVAFRANRVLLARHRWCRGVPRPSGRPAHVPRAASEPRGLPRLPRRRDDQGSSSRDRRLVLHLSDRP